jgi:predicted HAD superfamily Cof-like phosphohydrolase
MNAEQLAVKDFHKLFHSDDPGSPDITNPDLAALSIALIAEEFNELIVAIAGQDPVEVADALGDLLYVVNGAGLRFGIDLEPVFWEIHRSNLSKLPEDGVMKYREDGKVIKPETYSRPDLKPIIEKQKEYTGDGERKDNWYDTRNLGQGVPFGAPEPASDGEGIV